MARASPAEVVKAFLVARDEGDPDAALRVVHPAAVWESPVYGEVRGRQAIRKALVESSEETDWFRSEVESLHEHGRLVIAAVHNEGERAGDDLDSMQALVFRVQDGLITNVTIVVDDPAAVERFWTTS